MGLFVKKRFTWREALLNMYRYSIMVLIIPVGRCALSLLLSGHVTALHIKLGLPTQSEGKESRVRYQCVT